MWGGLSDLTVLSQESIILLKWLLLAVVIVIFLPPTLLLSGCSLWFFTLKTDSLKLTPTPLMIAKHITAVNVFCLIKEYV